MFSDPQFWIFIAFIIFIASIFNPIRKILAKSLDEKIKNIENSINEAEILKDQTQQALSEINKRQNEVKKENWCAYATSVTGIKNFEECVNSSRFMDPQKDCTKNVKLWCR